MSNRPKKKVLNIFDGLAAIEKYIVKLKKNILKNKTFYIVKEDDDKYYILSSDDRNIPREAIALIIEFDFKPKDLIYKILEEYMSKVKNASLEKLNNSELSNPLQLLGTLYCGSFIFGTVIKDRSDLERISQEKGVPLPYLKKLNLSEVWNDLNFSIRRKEKNIIALIIKYYINKGYDISSIIEEVYELEPFFIPEEKLPSYNYIPKYLEENTRFKLSYLDVLEKENYLIPSLENSSILRNVIFLLDTPSETKERISLLENAFSKINESHIYPYAVFIYYCFFILFRSIFVSDLKLISDSRILSNLNNLINRIRESLLKKVNLNKKFEEALNNITSKLENLPLKDKTLCLYNVEDIPLYVSSLKDFLLYSYKENPSFFFSGFSTYSEMTAYYSSLGFDELFEFLKLKPLVINEVEPNEHTTEFAIFTTFLFEFLKHIKTSLLTNGNVLQSLGILYSPKLRGEVSDFFENSFSNLSTLKHSFVVLANLFQKIEPFELADIINVLHFILVKLLHPNSNKFFGTKKYFEIFVKSFNLTSSLSPSNFSNDINPLERERFVAEVNNRLEPFKEFLSNISDFETLFYKASVELIKKYYSILENQNLFNFLNSLDVPTFKNAYNDYLEFKPYIVMNTAPIYELKDRSGAQFFSKLDLIFTRPFIFLFLVFSQNEKDFLNEIDNIKDPKLVEILRKLYEEYKDPNSLWNIFSNLKRSLFPLDSYENTYAHFPEFFKFCHPNFSLIATHRIVDFSSSLRKYIPPSDGTSIFTMNPSRKKDEIAFNRVIDYAKIFSKDKIKSHSSFSILQVLIYLKKLTRKVTVNSSTFTRNRLLLTKNKIKYISVYSIKTMLDRRFLEKAMVMKDYSFSAALPLLNHEFKHNYYSYFHFDRKLLPKISYADYGITYKVTPTLANILEDTQLNQDLLSLSANLLPRHNEEYSPPLQSYLDYSVFYFIKFLHNFEISLEDPNSKGKKKKSDREPTMDEPEPSDENDDSSEGGRRRVSNRQLSPLSLMDRFLEKRSFIEKVLDTLEKDTFLNSRFSTYKKDPTSTVYNTTNLLYTTLIGRPLSTSIAGTSPSIKRVPSEPPTVIALIDTSLSMTVESPFGIDYIKLAFEFLRYLSYTYSLQIFYLEFTTNIVGGGLIKRNQKGKLPEIPLTLGHTSINVPVKEFFDIVKSGRVPSELEGISYVFEEIKKSKNDVRAFFVFGDNADSLKFGKRGEMEEFFKLFNDNSKLFSNLKYLFLIPVDLDPLDTRGFEEYETKISQLLRSGSYNNLRNFLVYYRHLFSTLR